MSQERSSRRRAEHIRSAPHDALRVNLLDAEDTRYWCRKMKCTEHQLREAIEQVGPMPSNVEAYVNQRTSSLHNISLPPGKRPS